MLTGSNATPTFIFVDLDDLFFDAFEEVIIRERKGPHWRQDGKLYFVTWRQGDSIPREQREEIVRERRAWEERYQHLLPSKIPRAAKLTYARLYHKRIQFYLDNGYGSCLLRQEVPRRIIVDALHHFNGTRYRLGSFAVAGNHVHALVIPARGIDLSDVLHSWKSFTSNSINRSLGRTGTLWRPESYDRLVRDAGELERIEDYILSHKQQGAYVESHAFS